MWEQPLNPPSGPTGQATGLRIGEVFAVNADGSVDVRMVTSRATRTRAQCPDTFTATVGDRVLVADIDGAKDQPVVVAALTTTARPGPFPGAITAHACTNPPSGWLACNGDPVSRATYAALFAAIGTTYGAGDGSTTFNVPNLKGAVPVGYDSGQTEFNALNKSGGAKTHSLTVSEMPSHNHGVTDPGHRHMINAHYPTVNDGRYIPLYNDTYGYVDTGDGSYPLIKDSTTGVSIDNKGGGGSHNNLQPYLTLNYAIYAGRGT